MGPDDAAPEAQSPAPQALFDDVQEALEHLYDYVFLQSRPLSAVVGAAVEGWHRGASLHRLLVEAIERLKPPSGTPAHSPLWRRYRHAFMRYIEAETVAQIAEELGVSERQARRDNHEAVEAIAELLRQRLGSALKVYAPLSATPVATQKGAPSRSMGLDKEVARIGAIEPRGPTRLSDAVEGVLATITNLANAKGITFAVQMPPVAPLVPAERTTIRQMVLSMVVGAIELAVLGNEIVISVESQAGQASVAVTASLPADLAPPAIEDFERRVAIATKLATPHGGSVSYRSEVGHLSLSLGLPAIRQTTVLLIDDNPGMLRLLKRYLSGSEYTIVEAGDPDEGLRIANEIQPDVITLDVMMPSKDGWEVLQTLRAQPPTQRIPVIVCSVLKEQDLARSLGATAFLAKPITQDALLQALSGLRLSLER